MMTTYCLINPERQIVSRVEWDGKSIWHIPEGWTRLPESECSGLAEAPPPPPKLVPVTKLMIKRRLGVRWHVLKAVLDAMPEIREEWELAQEISPTDPLFSAHRQELQTALGLSDAEFAGLFQP